MLNKSKIIIYLAFVLFVYVILSHLSSGPEKWWIIDFVDDHDVFFGDDAYRLFLIRSIWINPDIWLYNFVLPAQLILDGVLVHLAEGSVYISRMLRAMISVCFISVFYLALLQTKKSKVAIASGIIIFSLFPRYAFMSLSFYGEIWLIFLLISAIYFWSKRSYLLLAFFLGLLPLTRLEGFLFCISFYLLFLKERRVKEIILMTLPGAIYFAYILFALDSLSTYFYWRIPLRDIIEKVDIGFELKDFKSVFSVYLLIPALLGSILAFKKFWPFYVAVLMWFFIYLISFLNGKFSFESRYFILYLPFLIIGWVFFLDYIIAIFNNSKIVVFLCSIFTITVVVINIYRTPSIKEYVDNNGAVDLISAIASGKLDEIYGYYPASTIKSRDEILDIIYQITSKDRLTDVVAISDPHIFYGLDPEKLPRYVTVGFVSISYPSFLLLLDGQVFMQHDGDTMYSYLNYDSYIPSESQKKVLVVDNLPFDEYLYHWRRDRYKLFLFAYERSLTADVDISKRSLPLLDEEEL